MEFNSKDRTEMIKARVSKEEKALIKAKAENYGYKQLSKYIRDAVIYEKVTYVDLKGKQEIYNAYAENTKEIKEITKAVRHLCTYLTQIDKQDIADLKFKMLTIMKYQKDMIKLIDKKLDLDLWQRINYSKF